MTFQTTVRKKTRQKKRKEVFYARDCGVGVSLVVGFDHL